MSNLGGCVGIQYGFFEFLNYECTEVLVWAFEPYLVIGSMMYMYVVCIQEHSVQVPYYRSTVQYVYHQDSI